MLLNPKDRDALAALAARADALQSRAIAWCEQTSFSGDLVGLEAQLALLLDAFAALPGDLERIPLSASLTIDDRGEARPRPHPDALRLTVRPEAPVQIALTGHYDTVHPPESPFRSVTRRADGTLHGPGVADMKGGISVMLGALECLETHPLAFRVGYRVLLSPDEEIGSPASAPELVGIARGAHLGLTYEPALADGALAAERKGSGNFHVVVTGRAAHAGRDFASGRNAVAAAAALAAALHGLNGGRDGVTVNVAAVAGGGPLNVVPDRAVVRFNVRLPDAASKDWIEAEIAALLHGASWEDGVRAVLHGGFSRPPKPFDPSQAALFSAAKQAAALLGQPLTWGPSGGVCEGNNLHAAGLPNIDTLGVRGGKIHSDEEFAVAESFSERAALSALILMKLASGEIDGPRIRSLRENH